MRCLLYHRGQGSQGEEDRLRIRAGGGLRAQVLRDQPGDTSARLRASLTIGNVANNHFLVRQRTIHLALGASRDGVAGAAPRLLGVPGRRRRRVRALVPNMPALPGGARRPARALAPPGPSVAAGWDDHGGLDLRAA